MHSFDYIHVDRSKYVLSDCFYTRINIEGEKKVYISIFILLHINFYQLLKISYMYDLDWSKNTVSIIFGSKLVAEP